MLLSWSDVLTAVACRLAYLLWPSPSLSGPGCGFVRLSTCLSVWNVM